MKHEGWQKQCGKIGTVRSVLLTALALSGLFLFAPNGWALQTGESAINLELPELRLSEASGFGIPTFYRPSERQETLGKNAPILGKIKLTLGRNRKVSLDAFSYGGKSATPNFTPSARLNFNGTPNGQIDPWILPTIVPRTALDTNRALDEQAQSFKIGLESGRGKFAMGLQNVGAKFPTTGIEGLTQQEAQAFAQAAGTRSLDLEGAFQLSKNAAFSSVRKSLYNDKPGDGNRGRTTTDWMNTLSLNMGKSTSLRMALTDHSEAWDASTGKTDTRKRTTEIGGETKFGAGGKYNLKFGLTDVQNTNGSSTQSERTQEVHLALPVHARLRLNADYTIKEDGSGNSLTTNIVGGVLQLYQGAELTASIKSLAPDSGKNTQETFLKFTGELGHGGSAMRLAAEQLATRTPDTGMVTNTKVEVNGGLGKGAGRLNVRGMLQDRWADIETGPLESVATLHLDRAFGPRLSIVADYEQKLKGTVGTYDSSLKSVIGITLQVAKQTKLTAGLMAQDIADGSGARTAWDHGLILEHKQGVLQFRAEDRRREEAGVQKAETSLGVEWPHGKLPDWANNITRRHEFGDIYEYQVAREGSWLDLPFAGTRVWAKQRTGGEFDGMQSLLVSHRMMVTKKFHVQLTYHERPEFEDGDKKGQPQSLHREYVELGTPVARGLVGRTWFMRERKIDDPLSQRFTLGVGIGGKIKNGAQTELYFSHDSGTWEAKMVEREVLALYYNRQLDAEHNLMVKVGYAWGESVSNGRDPEYRLTLALANPW